MKKLFYSLLFLFAFIGVTQAQVLPSDFYVYGQVTRTSDNSAVANKIVELWRDTVNGSGPSYYAATQTNASGNYNFYITNGSQIGPNQIYKVKVVDCQNANVIQSCQNNQGTVDIAQLNFSICDASNLCQAGFNTTPQNNNPLGIYFGNASTLTAGTITSWSWSYGDGTGQQSPQPNISSFHEYANPGTYTVCFTIATSEGCTSTFCDTIVVGNPNGNCVVGFSINPVNDSTYTFVGTSSGVAPFVYTYNFGDGPNYTTTNPTITHVYTTPGIYYPCLYVTDANGCTASYCTQDSIVVPGNNWPCDASFTIVPGNALYTYYLNATVSGGTWTITPGNPQPNPNGVVVFPNAGTYQVCYTVTTLGVTCDHCETVVVTNPNGNCTTTLGVTPLNNHEFTFNATSTGTAPFVYVYNFGDGPNQTFTTQPVNHSYTAPGTYNVCVYITDANGCVASDCEAVTVIMGSGCQAYFYSTPSNPNSLALQFTNYSVSGDSLHPITGYSWNFGDGETSSLQNPMHDYLVAGTYVVCLTAYNNFGCQSTYCDTIVVGNQNNTGCTSSFSWTTNFLGQTQFTGLGDSNNNGSIVSYQWSFGDGTSSTDQNPTHSFDPNSTHVVCLTITTSNGCTSTFCDSVVSGSSGGPCTAAFGFNIMNNPLEYHFISSNNTNDYTLEWVINGVIYTPAFDDQDFYYLFPDSGLYSVCLNIYNNNGCQDNYCQNIYVGNNGNPSGGCNPAFTVNPGNSNTTVQFIPVPNQTVSHSWSFGDGTSSTNADPVHTYTTPGTYYVCHTITGNNCQQTFCDSVVVGGGGLLNGSISGNVYVTNSTLASVAYVFLLQMDYPNSQILPADAGVVQNGGYLFSNVANGDYLVKAALTPNDPYYATRIPTYYTTAAYWYDADVITVNNNTITGADIHMIEATNPGGPGFIGGTVDWADTLRASGNLAGATVIVENLQGNIVTYAIADQNGSYSIPNLAYGTYKLTADYPGVTGNPIFITLTPFEPSNNDAQIVLGPATVGVKEEASVIGSINLFPNPANENATLMVETAKPAELSLTIVNLMGQTVSGQTINTNSGKTFIQLPLDNIAQGVYTLILRDSKGVAKVQKLIKQ